MSSVIVPISAKGKIPEVAKIGDAGVDLRYHGDHTIYLKPGDSILVPTGIRVVLPEGYELQIRPRSGLALKYSVTVLNSPGTIDSGYRGQIGVILINHGKEPFLISPGDRIAQAVLTRYENISWLPVNDEKYDEYTSERGSGGFGHSGK